MQTSIDIRLLPNTEITGAGHVLAVRSQEIGGSDFRILFEGDPEVIIGQLDILAAEVLEMRGRFLKRLANE